MHLFLTVENQKIEVHIKFSWETSSYKCCNKFHNRKRKLTQNKIRVFSSTEASDRLPKELFF